MSGFLGKIDKAFANIPTRYWLWGAILAFFTTLGIFHHNYLIAWPSPNIFLSTIDSDVYIRLTKVRELLEGGSLFNHIVAATNAPIGGVETPWTRPLDFILMTLYQLTPSDFSIEKRLLIVANWYPIIILPLIIYFLNKAAGTSVKTVHNLGLITICLIGDMLFNSHFYFMPGNADHHSLMALLWCITIWLILDKPSKISSISLGLCLGLWLWVSPEALPFLFLSLTILGVQTIYHPSFSYASLLTSVSLTCVLTLALFVEHPADAILNKTALDTNSIVYVVLFSLCTLGFFILHHIVNRYDTLKERIAYTGTAAVFLSALFLMLFPKFIKGPMADVDPYIISSFLPRISEATPLFKLDPEVIIGGQFLTLPALFLSLLFLKKSPKTLALFIVPMVMMLFQTRWYYYLEAISIVVIAKFLPIYARLIVRKYNKISFILNPYVISAIWLGAIYTIIQLLPPPKNAAYAYIDKCQFNGFQIIQSGELVKTLGQSNLTYESNILGNSGISFFTPYNYIAGYYHREGVGLQIKDKILDSVSLEEIRPLLKERNVSALMICPTGYPSWVNEYFEPNPKSRDWVKINQSIPNTESSDKKEHPVLLEIRP